MVPWIMPIQQLYVYVPGAAGVNSMVLSPGVKLCSNCSSRWKKRSLQPLMSSSSAWMIQRTGTPART